MPLMRNKLVEFNRYDGEEDDEEEDEDNCDNDDEDKIMITMMTKQKTMTIATIMMKTR